MTANRSPLKRPTSRRRRSPCSPISTASPMSLGIPRLRCEQVRCASRDDREACLRTGEDVDAALHHPVAAPGEDEVRAVVRARAADLAGAARLFGTSHQNGDRDSLGGEDAAQLGQATAEVLPECATTATFTPSSSAAVSSAAAAVRHANTITTSAAMPTTTPPPTSSGWCMPRYMRESATNPTIATAVAQANARKRLFVNREVSREQDRHRQRSTPPCGRTDSWH